MSDIVERLRNSSTGYKEWRVQNPADGAYCMSFSRRDSTNPEREAREWLEDHQRVYPESRFSQYVVACADMLTDGDRLAIEAADEITRLRAQVAALEVEVREISGGAGVYMGLLVDCIAVLHTIDPDNSDEAEKLRDLLDAIDRALEPSRHKGALL